MNNTINKTSLKMKTELVNISPAMADRWLAYNTGNRRLPVNNAGYFERQIKDGEWQITHQGIAFSGSRANPGRLLDGQTRLTAIRNCGQSVKMMITWNCPEEIFKVIDGGRPRSFSDHHGWPHAKVAFMNAIHSYAIDTRKPTKKMADKVIKHFGRDYDYLIETCGTARSKITTASVRAGFAIAMKKHPEAREQLAQYYRSMALSDLSGLPPSMVKLFARLIATEGGGRKVNAETLAMVVKSLDPKNTGHKRLHKPKECYRRELAQYIRKFLRA